MNKFTLRQSSILLLAAVIWGTAFVWQSEAGEHVPPFSFNALRFAIGALVLLPFIIYSDHKKKPDENSSSRIPRELLPGIACGGILFVAAALQQAGITAGVNVGKAGFITALYIVLVPVISLLFGKKPTVFIFVGALLAVGGLYLLCIKDESFSLEYADILILLCAFAYSGHILTIDHFAQTTDPLKLTAVQFASAAVFSSAAMAISERVTFETLSLAASPIILSGVLSCGVAFTLQTVGQKGMNPTVASLIMSLESVFSVVAGFVFLGDILTLREYVGCILMAAAIVLAQLPSPGSKKVKKYAKSLLKISRVVL